MIGTDAKAINTKTQYFLGVDGGGTKTKFTLCCSVQDTGAGEPTGDSSCFNSTATSEPTGDSTDFNSTATSEPTVDSSCFPVGSIVCEHISSSCHYLQIGFDGLEKMLRNGIETVCEKMRNDTGANTPNFASTDITRAFFGLAGYGDVKGDDPGIEAAVQKAAAGAFPFGISNDSEIALAGALGSKAGINIIAGTGSIGCGRDEHGGFYRCGGWNYALGGDEGSAYWIAHQLLHHFQRQSDGREKKTALHEAVINALSLSSDDMLVTRVVGEWNLDRTRIASLSTIVSRLASEGDPCAKEILASAAAELADYAVAIKNRLSFKGDVSVSGTGGIFRIGPDITYPFDKILREHGMHFVSPLYEPDLGAILLAASAAGQPE